MRYALLLAMLVIYAATAMGQVVARDFLLHAHFAPGGVDVGVRDYSVPHAHAEYPDPWDLVVRADGGGKREVYMTVVRGNTLDSKHVRSTINLSASSVADLIRVIRQANFFAFTRFISEGGIYAACTRARTLHPDGRSQARGYAELQRHPRPSSSQTASSHLEGATPTSSLSQ
jgi:hypothetical protein